MKDTKYEYAAFEPQLRPFLVARGSHGWPSTHAIITCCQASPVAHLFVFVWLRMLEVGAISRVA